ncbi:hypothetical protein CTI12_AA550410 [Artemisia annua]|uniref:Uncharacterized protein n=1 Tax=Artemisia annua TaxID=35608 RepID=A0A2U1KYP8_ARTAN|nr:hypothetical protein CTI12_AA550410 [Artemisia annua]
MEVTGSVFGEVPCWFKDSGVHGLKQQHRMFCRTRVRCCDNGFSDKSHVEYYNGGGTTRMEIRFQYKFAGKFKRWPEWIVVAGVGGG